MKVEKSKLKFAKFGLTLLVVGFLLGTLFAYAVSPSSTFTVSPGVYPGAPSYTVWVEGSNYFAKNANGIIEFSETNATQVINNVINAIDIGGLFLINGTYSISSPIYILGNKYITIEGEDREGTVLKNTNIITTLIYLGDGAGNDFTGRLTLRNIQFHGNDQNVNCIYLDNTVNNVFNLHCESVKFRNYGTDEAIGQSTKWFIDSLFEDTAFWFGGTSIILEQPTHVFIHCHFWELDNGIYLKHGAGAKFYGGIFSHNSRDISLADSTTYPDTFAFYGTWFEDSSDCVIGSSGSTIYHLVFSACDFHTLGTTVMYLATCNGNVSIIGGNLRSGSGTAFTFGNMHVETINFNPWKMRNSGSATIRASQTSVVVTHGLAGAPEAGHGTIIITSTADIGDIWITTITATQFTIHCDSAPGSDTTVFWYAEYYQ